jgi:hypothetical protein
MLVMKESLLSNNKNSMKLGMQIKIKRLERQIFFRSNKSKGHKQGSKNRIMSPLPEGGEP